jgi:hypothetical protein
VLETLKPDAGNAAVGSEEFKLPAMRFRRMAFFMTEVSSTDSTDSHRLTETKSAEICAICGLIAL